MISQVKERNSRKGAARSSDDVRRLVDYCLWREPVLLQSINYVRTDRAPDGVWKHKNSSSKRFSIQLMLLVTHDSSLGIHALEKCDRSGREKHLSFDVSGRLDDAPSPDYFVFILLVGDLRERIVGGVVVTSFS